MVFLLQTKFIQTQYNNDIVLIRLNAALTLSTNVSAICLPDKEIEPRQLCVIAGWGTSQPGGNTITFQIMYVF